MHVYPLDHKNKEGKLFWTLPKRPPTAVIFDIDNKLHKEFIESYSYLWANIWGFDKDKKADYKAIIDKIKIEPFKPKDSEAKKIKQDVNK